MKSLLLLVSITLLSIPGFAQSNSKVKRFEIFNSAVYGMEPNMEEVLSLSDEQKSKLEEAITARDENAELAAAQEAHQADKDNADLKKAFYVAKDTAHAEYKSKVAGILTAGQQSIVDNLNTLAAAAWKETEGGGTWPERNKLLREKAPEILRGALTPQQLSAIGINSIPESAEAKAEPSNP